MCFDHCEGDTAPRSATLAAVGGEVPEDEQCREVVEGLRCQRAYWHRGEHNTEPWRPRSTR
jgi:hypothetical protein